MSDLFGTYFENVFTPQNNSIYDKENFLRINKLYEDVKSYNECDKRLKYEVSESEVDQAVNSLKLRKAPGIDSIQAEHLKHGDNKVIFYLCKLFNGIIKCGAIPSEWKKVSLSQYIKETIKQKTLPIATDQYHYCIKYCTIHSMHGN